MTDLPIRPGFWNIPMWAEIMVYVIGLAAVLFAPGGFSKPFVYGRRVNPRHYRKTPSAVGWGFGVTASCTDVC